jgi:hypothetical protein
MMDQRMRNDLDNHITGHYGEDQYCQPRKKVERRKTVRAKRPAQQPQLEMPCESDFMAWCSIQHYNQAEAASIYRYIARHIKRVR